MPQRWEEMGGEERGGERRREVGGGRRWADVPGVARCCSGVRRWEERREEERGEERWEVAVDGSTSAVVHCDAAVG